MDLINQVFEIEKKSAALTESNSIQRNVKYMRNWFERELLWPTGSEPTLVSFTFSNPLGEPYNETRTDCDASIAGVGTEDLVITEVIKPIVWLAIGGSARTIVQQAVVIVESSRSISIDTTQSNQHIDSETATVMFAAGATQSLDVKPELQAEEVSENGAIHGTSPIAEASPEATLVDEPSDKAGSSGSDAAIETDASTNSPSL